MSYFAPGVNETRKSLYVVISIDCRMPATENDCCNARLMIVSERIRCVVLFGSCFSSHPTSAFEPSLILSDMDPLTLVYTSNPELAGHLELEQGLLQHFISQDKITAEYFIKAAHATGMEYKLTGALGKRTKFQINELSQLVLFTESQLKIKEQPTTIEPSPTGGQGPETLMLNNDTLLEQTTFTSSSPSAHSHLTHLNPLAQPALHPLDQSILLFMCLNVKNTSPVHGLTTEQMTPYVMYVISHTLN
jgi:hypothetical protein